jgi:hypothetical protein
MASDDGLQSAPPERVRRWLEGLHVEQRELSDYDRLIASLDGFAAEARALPSDPELEGPVPPLLLPPSAPTEES